MAFINDILTSSIIIAIMLKVPAHIGAVEIKRYPY